MPISQRLTRAYTTTAALYGLTDANIDAWYTARKAYITKLGNIYVVNPSSSVTFANIIDGTVGTLGGALTPTTANALSAGVNTTVRDIGKEIRIGTSTEASLLVLRLVQIPGPANTNGIQGDASNAFGTCWVVAENNCSDTFGAGTITPGETYRVRIARA